MCVNNAGIELRGPIEECSDDEVLVQFDTNVFGLLRVVRAVLPVMRAQGSGVIVNVGSLAGLVARPFGGLYSATKHAVEAITESLHFECAPFGMRVAVIEPGQFETELLNNAITAAEFTDDSHLQGGVGSLRRSPPATRRPTVTAPRPKWWPRRSSRSRRTTTPACAIWSAPMPISCGRCATAARSSSTSRRCAHALDWWD